jgi:PleD family two-component response regulator
MKQAPDAIYIVTASPARAEAIKQVMALRGFDEVVGVSLKAIDWNTMGQAAQPALLIVDAEGDEAALLAFMAHLPAGLKPLVLADRFEESVFLACHDAGARDFMVKPVPDAYLMSRVISTLQEHRLAQVARQKDQILEELGVISARSGVLTTNYLLKQLEVAVKAVEADPVQALSILMVAFQGGQPGQLGSLLKESARGLDWVGEYFMDKFVVVLPQTGKRGALALGRRIFQRLQQGHGGGISPGLRLRMGVAEYKGCRNYEELLNQALSQLQAEPEGTSVSRDIFASNA